MAGIADLVKKLCRFWLRAKACQTALDVAQASLACETAWTVGFSRDSTGHLRGGSEKKKGGASMAS
jgi:hypothetical protein